MWRDPRRPYYEPPQGYEIRYQVPGFGWGEPLQVNRRPDRGLRFSDHEKREIAESVGLLTLAFTLALSGGLDPVLADPLKLAVTLPLAFAAVITGFLLHEVGHKWMAQRYGCWAEYRGNRNGLFIALLMSTFGFLLAAPGAVMIMGHITRRQNGYIALAGPFVNLALALVTLPLYLLLADGAGALEWIGELFRFLVMINLLLAGFNLIPVPPLDGSKIMQWSGFAYAATVAALLMLAMAYWSL